MGLFFRNILTITPLEEAEGVGLLGVTSAALAAGFHRWVWVSFDPVSAEVAGLKVGRWTFAFNVLFALAMTLAIHIVGVLLAFAYLLLPATAGLSLSRRLSGVFLTAILTAVGATVAGFALSMRWDLPTGSLVAALLATAALAARVVGREKS
jgi:ABC-type Mn2+/Zn2+ transport system permease subunit